MVAVLLPNGQQQFFDDDGNPLALGTVDFYVPSTTTRKNTWSDRAQTSLNTNPVVLDAAGRATIWGDGNYRQVVKDALGNTIWDKETSGAPDLTSIYGTGYNNTYTAVGGETSIPLTDQSGNPFTVETSAVWTLSFFRNGVRQQPTTDYTTNGTSNVTITTAAIAGEVFWWVQTGGSVASVVTPSDGSVTPPKLSTITATADNVPYFASATTWGQTPFPAFGRVLVGNASAADARTDLGLVIGTDVQAYNQYLADIAAITPSQGDIIYFNGTDWVRLAAGTNGYFLKTQGAGANPAWDAVAAGGITINTTTITGGTSGRVLYNNAGTVGEKAVTGTGDAVLATSPTLVTPNIGVATATSINFGGTALSAYDEGTWTPVFTCATPGDLSVTYSAQAGYYTRVGRLVTLAFRIVTSAFTHSTASGNVNITGAPYTSNTASNFRAYGAIGFQGYTNATYPLVTAVSIANNTTTLLPIISYTAQANTVAQISSFPTGGSLIFNGSITYMT